MNAADAALPRGEIVTLHFDGRDAVVWWGPGPDDVDRVLTRGRRAVTWPTADACEQDAVMLGWTGLRSTDGEDQPIDRSTSDFGPVQDWLRGRRLLDYESALNLWNFAGDVAVSIDQAWGHRGQVADRCYDKLFAATLPHLCGLVEYHPRWSALELRRLREVLSSSIHLFRVALT